MAQSELCLAPASLGPSLTASEGWGPACDLPQFCLLPVHEPSCSPSKASGVSRRDFHHLFGRAIFNRDRSLLRFPLWLHKEPRHVCWSGMARGELPRPGRLLQGARFQPALLRSPQPGSPHAHLVLRFAPKGLKRPCPAPHAELRGQHGLGRMGITRVGAVPGGPIASSILRSQLAAGTAPRAGARPGCPRHSHVLPSAPCLPSRGALPGGDGIPERQMEGRAFPCGRGSICGRQLHFLPPPEIITRQSVARRSDSEAK